jgi:hypothetical protein
MKSAHLKFFVQYFEIRKAVKMVWDSGYKEQDAYIDAFREVACLYDFRKNYSLMDLAWAIENKKSNIIRAGSWLAFFNQEVHWTLLSKNDLVPATQLYKRFSQFWLRRNPDIEVSPSQKVFGTCLKISGFKRVKKRTHICWQGLSLKEKRYRYGR